MSKISIFYLFFFYLQELKNVKRKAKWTYSLTDKIAQNQHTTEQQIIYDYLISLCVRNCFVFCLRTTDLTCNQLKKHTLVGRIN